VNREWRSLDVSREAEARAPGCSSKLAQSRSTAYEKLEMRARRKDPAGVSHRLLVRYHDGIMTACRLQSIDLEGDTMARCEMRQELGELLATEQ
jgi:hypothetical protein